MIILERIVHAIDLVMVTSEPRLGEQEATIPLCVPGIQGCEHVKECLDSSWVSPVGPSVDRIEPELADYVGAENAVAVTRGTAALHIASLAATVEPDDEVLVSSLTCIGPADVGRYVGAWPVFIDAEPDF